MVVAVAEGLLVDEGLFDDEPQAERRRAPKAIAPTIAVAPRTIGGRRETRRDSASVERRRMRDMGVPPYEC
jgi:hypothetical protein